MRREQGDQLTRRRIRMSFPPHTHLQVSQRILLHIPPHPVWILCTDGEQYQRMQEILFWLGLGQDLWAASLLFYFKRTAVF